MIDYILCLLGIVIYFTTRYSNRTNKRKPLSFTYWVRDNKPELITTLAMNAAFMIIIHLPEGYKAIITLFAMLPFTVDSTIGVATTSFLLGLGATAAFYRLFKSKLSTVK